MNKLGLAGVSLIAAIPAWILVVLLAMAFMNHAESMNGTLQILLIVLIVLGAVVGLGPVAAMLFGPKAEPAAAKANETDESADEIDVVEPLDADEEFGDFGEESSQEFGEADIAEEGDEAPVVEFDDSDFEDLDFDEDEDK